MKTPQDIVKALIKAGFNQYEISVHTGVPQPTISRLLNSPKLNPRWQTVQALNDFLETVNGFEDEDI